MEKDGEVAEVKKPDVEELRRIRAAYFGRPLIGRRKTVTPAVRRRPIEIGSPTSRRATSDEHVHKRPKSSSSRKTARVSKEPVSRTAEYVYGGLVSPLAVPEAQNGETPPRRRSVKSNSSRHSSSSKRRSLPSVLEEEVTPDDSISQVAERQMHGERSPSVRTRSASKRHSTPSARLPSIHEKPSDATSSATSRRSKRESSLLTSLFRRNSVTAESHAPRLVECLTCGSDDVPSTKTAKLACGHRMCNDCLKRVFTMSVTDPVHMPPRCCTDDHIPLKHVDKLFDLKFKMLWNRKYQEYHTKNRAYCPNVSCGDWIKPSHFHTREGRKFALCPHCKTKVCLLCNNKLHKSRECPKDPEIARLVETAKEKGWQRCFSCHSMVELKEGCNHMTCRCTAEFCMICGSKWKTCDCPWFNYNQLSDFDQLNEMRVPEPIQIIYRQVFGAARPEQAAQPPPPPPSGAQAQPHRSPGRRTGVTRETTYQQEMDQRRRQERLDADLAHRMQLASLMEGDDEPTARARQATETWGLGNAADHFMNDDFVQNAADVVMSAFGDANMGRRGERASGRRRRPTQEGAAAGSVGRDAGLALNFLGDESVLGAGSATRPGRTSA